MKLAGMHYLQVTLKPIIDEVWRCDTPVPFPLLTVFFHCILTGHTCGTSEDIWENLLPMEVLRLFSKSSQICAEHKPCEIDPVKLKESENLDTNRVRRRVCVCVCVCVCLCWVDHCHVVWHLRPALSLSPQENLRQYVDRIFNVITTSGVRCPTVMCDIFFSLRESAATRFQGNSPAEQNTRDGGRRKKERKKESG